MSEKNYPCEDCHISEKEIESLKAKLDVARLHLEKTLFALQCMIINKNGSVPTMTDEQVFISATNIRDVARQALKELER